MTCQYLRPRTIAEALDALRTHEGAKPLAGGVALVGLMNQKLFAPRCLVDVSRIDALQGLRRPPDGTLTIGALVTHGDIERSPMIQQDFPLLHEMAREIACGRIRNRGTIGGNLCHADPQEDPPAALLALGATVRLRGPDGARELPIREFFTDMFTTAIGEHELLESVSVPTPRPHAGSAYTKFGPRRAMDYTSTISVAVTLVADPMRGVVTDVGIGMSGVGSTPIAPRAAATLVGQRPGPEVLEQLSRAVATELDPVSDFEFSSDFKRHIAGVLLRRTVVRAWERAAQVQEPR